MIVGRIAERSRIEQLLDGARKGKSGSLLIAGDAGIGKTALLRHARDHAPGFVVLTARGVQSESEIAFSGLSDVLRPMLDEIDRIAEPQAVALKGALALAPPTAADPFTIYAATLSTLAAAAEKVPLLVLVDDLHWLDSESARALLFAARRVAVEGIVMLFAAREGEAHDLDLSGLEAMTVGGLGPDESMELLVAFVSHPMSTEVADRLVASTRGNPLALLEIPTLLTKGQLAGKRDLADPLPAGPSIEQAFERRISGLPRDARKALTVAAASDSESTATITSALTRLSLPDSALEPAESSGLVTNDGSTLTFRHPLLRSSAYHRASPIERRAAHEALADVLAGAGAEARSAWHRASAAVGADENVASGLEKAGAEAAGRTGHAAAARAFERAAALSTEPERKAARLLQAANSMQLAGRPDRAVELLDDALASTSDPLMRADIQTVRGRVEIWRGAPMKAHAMLIKEASEVESIDSSRAALMLATATTPCFMAAELTLARDTAERAQRIAEESGGIPAVFAHTLLAGAKTLLGEGASARPLLDEALNLIAESEIVLPLHELAGLVAINLAWLEEYNEARKVVNRLIEEARRLSAPAILPYVLSVSSEIDFRTGRWADAHADAVEAHQLALETGQQNVGSYTLVNLARIDAAQGHDAECRAHAKGALQIAARLGVESIPVYAYAALGLLELGRGNPEGAIRQLEQVAARAESQRLGEPNAVQWAPDLIEAYVRAGRTDSAERALGRLEVQAQATERRWAQAAVHRCRGLLEPGNHAVHFERALELQSARDASFERARTRLCYGQRLGAVGQKATAADRLQSALVTFERLGASPWADRTREALADIGGRARRRVVPIGQRLTHQELQIARLVAQGRTNKETAAALFVSPKTVEAHLGSIYRKLEIRSRTDLARVMTEEGALLDADERSATVGS
ncbi:MAG: helix-turn-helix transcriptional regulator [Actinomycetota bacterium]